MKKPLSIVLILVTIAAAAGGGYWLYTQNTTDSKDQQEDTKDEEDPNTELESHQDQDDFYEESLNTYSESQTVNFDGAFQYTDGGQAYDIQVDGTVKGLYEKYLHAVLDGNNLYLYVEEEAQVPYAYVADDEEAVRFTIEEDSTGEEKFDEVEEMYNPAYLIYELEAALEDSSGVYDDYEVKYLGLVDCQDLKCHRYEVTEESDGSKGTTTIDIDTKEQLPRYVILDTPEINGAFDLSYEENDISYPQDYKDIDPATILGLRDLKQITDPFLELFY